MCEDGETWMLALQLTTTRSTVNDSAIVSNDTKYSYEDLAEATAYQGTKMRYLISAGYTL